MKKWFLLFASLFIFQGCTSVYRVKVEVEKPPAVNFRVKALHIKVKEKSLKNDFVEIRNVKGEVEKFLKNELETEGGIKILPGEGQPLLLATYEASLRRAYTYYSPEGSVAPPRLVSVKIIKMKMCFSIKKYKYRTCIEERMKFQEYESSIFALYSVLQRMTSRLLSDIAYKKREIMHYLLR